METGYRSVFLARIVRITLILLLALQAGCGTPFGIYHKVEAGQTLYRIASTYNVSVQKVMSINRIDDPTRIRTGQLLFIPGASRPRLVPEYAAPAGDQLKKKRDTVHETTPPKHSTPTRIILPERPVPPGLQLSWPIQGQVTSPFGTLDDRVHDGVDISAAQGTPIKAAADGQVIYAGDGIRGYGNLVILKHEDGVSTVYAHNKTNKVQKGEFISRGEIIGTVGNTGRASGYHLHFEIRVGKKPVDPLKYLTR